MTEQEHKLIDREHKLIDRERELIDQGNREIEQVKTTISDLFLADRPGRWEETWQGQRLLFDDAGVTIKVELETSKSGWRSYYTGHAVIVVVRRDLSFKCQTSYYRYLPAVKSWNFDRIVAVVKEWESHFQVLVRDAQVKKEATQDELGRLALCLTADRGLDGLYSIKVSCANRLTLEQVQAINTALLLNYSTK